MTSLNKQINITLNGPINFTISCSDVPSTPAEPIPLVSADFKNGVYSIDGVSKTLAEVCVASGGWAAFNASHVASGEGLKRTGGQSGGPILSAEAYAAVTDNFVTVLSYIISGQPSAHNLNIELGPVELAGFSVGIFASVGSPYSGVAQALIYDYDGGTSNIVGATSAGGNGTHKAAWLQNGTSASISFNGAAVVSGTTQNSNTATAFGIYLSGEDSDPAAYVILEKIEFFSLSDYSAADLPALSTP